MSIVFVTLKSISCRTTFGPLALSAPMIAVILGACGNDVIVPAASGGSAHGTGGAASSSSVASAAMTGGASSSSSSTTTGSSGSGGSLGLGGGAGSGGATACMAVPKDPDAGFQPPTCADLGGMTVSDPVIADASGDGKVSPGESAIITVRLTDVAGKGFTQYPGVKLSSDVAVIPQPESVVFYAILPCTSLEGGALVTIPSSVAAGTVVKVRAQAAMLGMDCPGAPSIVVLIQVQ
jgi:hypothetical protein